ncbi:MAG: hypothetical protein IJ512_08930 [Ruminococcus sp.]|nr:hypothetical protein [Ruminococcus sp.]
MNCKKTVGLLTALVLTAGTFSYSGSAASAPATGVRNGGYLQIYAHNTPEGASVSDVPVVQAADLPASYDLRDDDLVTPVHNQGAEGMCFAFAALGACETNLLMQGLETDCNTLDLSEAHMGHFLYTQQEDPLDPLSGDYLMTANKGASGGNGIFAAAALASRIGTQKEQFCSYDDWGSDYSAYQRYAAQYRLRTMKNMTQATTDDARAVIKEWILETGGVSIAFYSKRSLYYDNGTSYAYYAPDTSFYQDANHAALIVGWDDDYSRDNFSEDNRPDYDGAWLVKNSYGADLFDDGYFWLSYEDPSVGSYCSYDMMPVSDYGDIYEYDGAGYITSYSYEAAANVFVAEYDCTLSDVAFYMPGANQNNASYEIQVYRLPENTDDPTDGELVSRANGTLAYSGYYTIPLKKNVSLHEGDQFSVVLRIKRADGATGYLPIEENMSIATGFDLHYDANPGESYVFNGAEWIDTAGMDGEHGILGNVNLKALTVRAEESAPLRLEAAISAAEQSGFISDALTEALSLAEGIYQSSTAAADHAYASATLLSVLETETGTPAYPEYLYEDLAAEPGDSDLNGTIDISDATETLRVYAERSAGYTIRLRRTVTYAMDAVSDGTIGLEDASAILKKYAESAAAMG